MLFLGVALRLLLAPIGGHPFDTYVWYDTAQRVFAGEPFYGVTQYSYPPTWAAMLGAAEAAYQPLATALGAHPVSAGQLAQIMGHPIFLAAPEVVDWLFLLLIKLPIIAADLGIGLVLRRIVARRWGEASLANRAFAWYFLNPYIIWISAVWGMFDALPTFFTLAGILLFLDRRDALSGLTFALATSLKYFPVLLALGLLVAYRGSLSRQRLARFGAGFIAVLGGVSLPFLVTAPGTYLQGVLSPTSGANAGRVSVWAVLAVFGNLQLPLVIAAADILITVVLVAWLSALQGPRPEASVQRDLWVRSGLVSLATFYVLNYSVNPQYFVWIIPFLILDALGPRGSPRVLGLVTGMVLGYIVTGVQHYSFFLPLVTISPGLAPFIIPMPSLLPLTAGLAFGVWILMLDLLRARVRQAGGRPALRRVVDEFLRAIGLPPRETKNDPRTR